MNFAQVLQDKPVRPHAITAGDEPDYESPLLIDLGHVRDVTLGSSSSGSADANSQYYW
ncbi:lasso RiPP family leader peptide-containing protein [Amycolatopsis nigrescens]|uniref:lasso RiPP family leader peptide-containing protein n=1 Tax=Amycolatopsis nigrescens TaxID=381445 RepID=UPI000381A918|nr:lasso RiPP family leader peptide-containing protein [Amycolatopsis nigrescens]